MLFWGEKVEFDQEDPADVQLLEVLGFWPDVGPFAVEAVHKKASQRLNDESLARYAGDYSGERLQRMGLLQTTVGNLALRLPPSAPMSK